MAFGKTIRCGLVTLGLSAVSGCTVYNPHQLWRFEFDYNTERALSAQFVGYDHLPPREARMRLQKWAYNVGPSPVRTPLTIPENSPVSPTPSAPPPVVPPTPAPDLSKPAEPSFPVPGSLILPPALPGNPGRPLLEPNGPTAAASPHRRVSPAAWMLVTPGP